MQAVQSVGADAVEEVLGGRRPDLADAGPAVGLDQRKEIGIACAIGQGAGHAFHQCGIAGLLACRREVAEGLGQIFDPQLRAAPCLMSCRGMGQPVGPFQTVRLARAVHGASRRQVKDVRADARGQRQAEGQQVEHHVRLVQQGGLDRGQPDRLHVLDQCAAIG